ncbi:MAG: hypothetical protein M3271_09470, partial [Actinomycetota bacterium]|nr:hypothetical protein [Actinomycetota bacterium]
MAEVHGNDAVQPCCAKPLDHERDIVRDIVELMPWEVAERDRPTLCPVLLDRGWFRERRHRQVFANALDVGRAALRRFGDRSPRGDERVWV